MARRPESDSSLPVPEDLGPATDPALHPEREEEDQLLRPEAGPDLAFQWDVPGRLRKIGLLVTHPRQLAAELVGAPDIFTPLMLLTIVGVGYMLAFGAQLHPIIKADITQVYDQIPAAQLSDMQREGLPEATATMVLWSVAAIGINHILLCGVYALGVYWVARFLRLGPLGYPHWLSLMAFAWLPRPLYTLGVDLTLLLSRHYDSWNALKADASHWYPGLHLLLPAELPFDQYWGLATYYLLGPIDLFLLLALGFTWVALPVGLIARQHHIRFVIAIGLLFVLASATIQRAKMPPEALQALTLETRQILQEGGQPPSPGR